MYPFGGCTVSIIASNNGIISTASSSSSATETPSLADAYITLKSNCSSVAPNSTNKSKISSITASGLASFLSILLMTTIGSNPSSNAFLRTNLVCGIAPSYASTTSKTLSTILSTRSTSPPKSACPGVSIMFILTPLYITAVFFERIVIPLSRSKSFESITLSCITSFSLKTLLCFKSASTKVVLPWSTWAIIAIFLMSSLVYKFIFFLQNFILIIIYKIKLDT